MIVLFGAINPNYNHYKLSKKLVSAGPKAHCDQGHATAQGVVDVARLSAYGHSYGAAPPQCGRRLHHGRPQAGGDRLLPREQLPRAHCGRRRVRRIRSSEVLLRPSAQTDIQGMILVLDRC